MFLNILLYLFIARIFYFMKAILIIFLLVPQIVFAKSIDILDYKHVEFIRQNDSGLRPKAAVDNQAPKEKIDTAVNIMRYATIFMAIIAASSIILAGFYLFVSSGNISAVNKAKSMIISGAGSLFVYIGLYNLFSYLIQNTGILDLFYF